MTTNSDENNFGIFLRESIERLGMRKKLAAAKIGVADTTLTHWFAKPVPKMRPENKVNTAKLLGIPLHEFEARLKKAKLAAEKSIVAEEFVGEIDPRDIIPVPEIPQFQLAVAGGPWTEVGEIAELHEDHKILDGRFRISIRGNSMETAWPDGSLVEFRRLRWGVDNLIIGESYYVQVDSMATFKRLEKIEQDLLTFRAINRKKYPEAIPVDRNLIVQLARAEYILTRPKGP